MRLTLVLLIALLTGATAAGAKDFRYSTGPKPDTDTTLSTASVQIDPIVSERGPKVAPTNLQLISMVANRGVERALQTAQIDSGMHVLLVPAESHPLNFVMERAALRALTRRGVSATVRRTLVPDDSLTTLGPDPMLEYSLSSARITYLRLIGGYLLPSRVKIERQGLVEGAVTLRNPADARVLWTNDVSDNLVDQFPRGQLKQVEDDRYSDLKAEVPERNLGRLVEPVIVIAVVAGLVLLFFQNRP